MAWQSLFRGYLTLPCTDIYALALGHCAPSGIVRIWYQAKHSCLCYNLYIYFILWTPVYMQYRRYLVPACAVIKIMQPQPEVTNKYWPGWVGNLLSFGRTTLVSCKERINYWHCVYYPWCTVCISMLRWLSCDPVGCSLESVSYKGRVFN